MRFLTSQSANAQAPAYSVAVFGLAGLPDTPAASRDAATRAALDLCLEHNRPAIVREGAKILATVHPATI